MKKLAPALLAVSVLTLTGCATYRLAKTLDPDSKEFLSKVRYIITGAERKSFVNLPAAERPKFIVEFWKKRDPDPDTEENEFKDQYFQRIEEANHLFTEGGEPGWLQDRGRIYILLGPPSERLAYPRGVTFYGLPTEYWYYGFFQIVFIDDYWNGKYRLDPDSAAQLTVIMRAQMEWKPTIQSEERTLDCSLDVKGPKGGQATVRILIPYRTIWMTSEDKKLKTTLAVSLEALDAAGAKVWDHHQDWPLSLTEERLEQIILDDIVIEVPLALKSGDYMLNLALTNGADGTKIFKRARIHF
jgi:GWxTD domain-containing protein